MAEQDTVSVTDGSAFHALGRADADDLEFRAGLMVRIGDIVRQRRLTQVRAGELLGMDQPRVSALMRGKVSLFSTERLLKALNDLGQDVEVRISDATQGKGRLRLVERPPATA